MSLRQFGLDLDVIADPPFQRLRGLDYVNAFAEGVDP
jgi:hypothetical protein